MDRHAERQRAIDAAISDIRAIETRDGVTRGALEKIKARLMQLAARKELFTLDEFPPPEAGEKRKSCLYRLHEDADHRFALYANASRGGYGTPAHNHTTWAVIVGVLGGDEENRLYDRTAEGGVSEKERCVVRAGSGVTFLPDDLHSIHIEEPLLNFHLYGLGLEQLARREYYVPEEHKWAIFAPHSDIREARGDRA